MNKMKKFLSTVATLILTVTSAMPLIASAEEHITGDINNDGIVNGTDAVLVLDYYSRINSNLSTENLPEIENILAYGDVNNDGFINVVDTTFIMNIGINTLDPNEDGSVDEYDVKYIQNIAYNIESYSKEETYDIINRTALDPMYIDEYYGYNFPKLKEILLIYATNLIAPLNLRIGDANDDGFIDASDSSELLSTYADISSGQQVNFNNDVYDFNGDGNVNSSDASQVLAYYAEMSSGN